jgi:hypothetical protein
MSGDIPETSVLLAALPAAAGEAAMRLWQQALVAARAEIEFSLSEQRSVLSNERAQLLGFADTLNQREARLQARERELAAMLREIRALLAAGDAGEPEVRDQAFGLIAQMKFADAGR